MAPPRLGDVGAAPSDTSWGLRAGDTPFSTRGRWERMAAMPEDALGIWGPSMVIQASPACPHLPSCHPGPVPSPLKLQLLL